MKYFISIALLSLFLTSCTNYGEKVKYGNNELFYTKNVTRQDALKLGDYLTQQGFFTNDGKTVSVQLDKVKDTFLFRMVVLDSFINNKDFLEKGKMFGPDLSENVFDKRSVVVNFCDNRFNTVHEIRN